MAEEIILYNLRDGVAHVTLNDPATRNAISQELAEALIAALDRAGREARAVLLAGAGQGFCSGANLASSPVDLDDPLRDAGTSLDKWLHPMVRAVRNLDLPVIVAVQGAAAGIGSSLALSGDIIVCGESAFFMQAFRQVGLAGDGGASWLLSRTVGRVRAMELLLLGERISAVRALEWGLVNRVVPDAQVQEAALELARKVAEGPRSMRLIKRTVWAAGDEAFEAVLAAERASQREASRSDDFVEGVSAFREKRPPEFRGR